MRSRFVIILCLYLLLLAAGLSPSSASAQANPDTINYSSTCVNASVVFGSPLLDTFFTPNYIRWHFGDPGSGYNDSSGGKNPVGSRVRSSAIMATIAPYGTIHLSGPLVIHATARA